MTMGGKGRCHELLSADPEAAILQKAMMLTAGMEIVC
jgi:hypothetical protein